MRVHRIIFYTCACRHVRKQILRHVCVLNKYKTSSLNTHKASSFQVYFITAGMNVNQVCVRGRLCCAFVHAPHCSQLCRRIAKFRRNFIRSGWLIASLQRKRKNPDVESFLINLGKKFLYKAFSPATILPVRYVTGEQPPLKYCVAYLHHHKLQSTVGASRLIIRSTSCETPFCHVLPRDPSGPLPSH